MSNAKLQPVLDRIDADFDNSLERLFALLRIKSISADPANAGDCKAAADHLAKDIATLGFTAEVKPTGGHPAVIAKMNGSTDGRPHVLFYGHYDVQPVDPLNLWHRPPFEPAVTDHADGRKIIVARGAEDDKGQLMTFVEACRAWKSVTGSLPLFPTDLQAYGNNLVATVLLVAGLVWHIRNPPLAGAADALPPAAGQAKT